MTLTFKSSIPERFEIRSVDSNGRERIAVATKHADDFKWRMQLRHPSGRSWNADFHGPNILDALGELMTSKDVEYKQERSRGYRAEPRESFDHNRTVGSDAVAPIYGSINIRR